MGKAAPRHLLSADGSRQFQYFAFISYKRVDEAAAKWLKKKLELYRLPLRLSKEADRPQCLDPICRDEENWTLGPDVYTHMDEKLAQSKFLIVICSRNMQKNPEFINYEIRKFLELGNPVSHILPLIIDGEGCARDPENEAFPPALLEMDEHIRPRGAKLNARRKKDTILELVATMHGIERNALQSHDRERQHKRLLGTLAAGLVCSLALATFMVWEVLSVKQAQLREQNVYAQSTFFQGDRRKAQAMAASVLEAHGPLMAPDIVLDAATTAYLSGVEPLLSPLTMLENAYSNTKAQFAVSGDQVILYSPDRVHIYDLDGKLLHSYGLEGLGQQFVAVSPDGDRAVTMTVFENSKEIVLWLCSLRQGQRIAPLVAVGAEDLDQTDASAGQYQTVAQAKFSSDGTMVCAYRTGGYFNSSSYLQVYSSEDGKALVSLDASALGDAGNGFVIADFEFLPHRRLHWTGSWYHVIHDLDSGRTWQVPLADLTTSGQGREGWGYLKMLPQTQADGSTRLLLDNLIDEAPAREIFFPQGRLSRKDCHLIAGGYGFAAARDASGQILQAELYDLETMTTFLETQPVMCQYSQVDVLQCQGEATFYLYFTQGNALTQGNLLVRVEPGNTTVKAYRVGSSFGLNGNIRFAGSCQGEDWLLAGTDTGTAVLRIGSGGTTQFVLEEPYAVFAATARISPTEGMLVAQHGSHFTLYPLKNPGTRLDYRVDWTDQTGDTCLAASGDGQVVAKAKGQKFAVFREGKLVLEVDTPDPLRAVTVSHNGKRIACADEKTVYLYTSAGKLLATYAAADGELLWDVRFVPDGSRLLAAIAPEDSGRWPACDLWLLDGNTLEQITLVTQVFKALGGHTDVISGTHAAAMPLYTVSPDSRYIAAVDLVWKEVSPGVQNYQRVVSLFSAQDGRLIASGPIASGANGQVLDLSDNYSQAAGFSYIHFAQSGKLLAGFSRGVWVIDPKSLDCDFVSAPSSPCTDPEQLPDGTILFPGVGLQLLDGASGASLGSFAVEGDFLLRLSPEGDWAAIADGAATRIVSTQELSCWGTLANQGVDVVYLDSRQIIYDSPDGLYRIITKTEELE